MTFNRYLLTFAINADKVKILAHSALRMYKFVGRI
jgi:hypothetical protein